jgi:hypothetical protein
VSWKKCASSRPRGTTASLGVARDKRDYPNVANSFRGQKATFREEDLSGLGYNNSAIASVGGFGRGIDFNGTVH